MAHQHQHPHAHDHDHDHEHHHSDDHHHRDSGDYVRSWVAQDASRKRERAAIIERMIGATSFARDAAIGILDVGGGSGVISELFLEAFPRAKVAIQDFSPHMLENARARAGDATPPCPRAAKQRN